MEDTNDETKMEEEEGDEEGFFDEEEGEELDLTNYKLVKRAPQRLSTRPNDIYVSRSSKFIALLNRAKELVNSDSVLEFTIHGLGAAMNRAIELALTLRDELKGTITISCNTSTVKLIDDFEPLVDDLPPISRERYNSAIHIKVSKIQKQSTTPS